MTTLIEAAVEANTTPNRYRTYLSMSTIGEPCLRKQWLQFRWATVLEPIDARLQRIFDRGHLEESRIIKDLKDVGVQVFRKDEHGNEHELFGIKTEPQEEVVGFESHALGHPDGRVRNLPDAPEYELVLEMKTMKDEYFDEVSRYKVKQSFPVYYSQVQRYMERTSLPAALFIATNKNNEERYYEYIGADKKHQIELVESERQIVLNELPFRRTYPKGHYKCHECRHKKVCDGAMPAKNCRTCAHVSTEPDGQWSCERYKRMLTREDQELACQFYKRLF